MAIKEPYVKVIEQVVDYPSTSNIDDTTLMAGVVNAPCGPDHALIQGPRQFLDTFTVDGSIPRSADTTLINAYYCSFFAPILVKRVWSANGDKVPVFSAKFSDESVSSANVDVNSLPVSEISSIPAGSNISWKYPIDSLSSSSVVPALEPTVGLVSLDKWISISNSTEEPSDSAELLIYGFRSTEFNEIESSESSENKLMVIYWSDKNTNSNGYELVSLIDDGINPLTDRAVYWEDVLDDEAIPFITDLSTITWVVDYEKSVVIKSNILANYNISSNAVVGDYDSAVEFFSNNSDVYNISAIEDFGYVKGTGYQLKLSGLADKNKWFYILNVDPSCTSVSDIKEYVANLGLNDNYRTMIVGGYNRSAAVTSWRTNITTSSLVWQRIYSNKASNSEFAPVFDITNGVLNVSKLVVSLDKPSREELLSNAKPINWIKYDRTNEVYYLNDNRTSTRKQNVMNEEMNVRMINKIQRDILLLLPKYKGQLNNDKTRLDCKGLLENYMDTSIMSQNYRPVEYKIVCDETNNTDSIINANKLAVSVFVRLQGSIKYIEVLNKIYPLGVAFDL